MGRVYGQGVAGLEAAPRRRQATFVSVWGLGPAAHVSINQRD